MAELPQLEISQFSISTLTLVDEYEISGSITALGRSTAQDEQCLDLDRPLNHFDFLSYDEACIAYENATEPLQYHYSGQANTVDMGAVLRWDGLQRKQTKWDSLKMDPELFDKDGDVAIHFHHNASSQRGPSIRVSKDAIVKAGCSRLLDTHCYERTSLAGSVTSFASAPSEDSGYSSAGSEDKVTDLFFPVPFMLPRDEAVTYHQTTRNLFAWIMNKPLVGSSLGNAMISLLERMLQVRSATKSNLDDCITYAERMGYMDMADQPSHALAMAAFAEHAGCETIRHDAFVHCVGMSDVLETSPELLHINKDTRAAIEQEAAALKSKIYSTVDGLSTFFKQETSSKALGLSIAQYGHLERFRSFLRSFYTSKHGHWPLKQTNKRILDGLRHDFQSLYDLIAHRAGKSQSTTLLDGGLRALKIVTDFDERHSYISLPSNLPILPACAILNGHTLGGTKTFFRSSSTRRAIETRATSELAAAVNHDVPTAKGGLATAYLRFERDSLTQLSPSLTIGDARKVCWVQIYITLQILNSATQSTLHHKLPTTYYTSCSPPPPKLRPKSALRIHPAMRQPIVSVSDTDSALMAYIDPLRVPTRRTSLRRPQSLCLPTHPRQNQPPQRSTSAPARWLIPPEAGVADFASALRRASSLSANSSVRSSVYSRSTGRPLSSISAFSDGGSTSSSVSSSPLVSPLTPLSPQSPLGGDGLWECKTEE